MKLFLKLAFCFFGAHRVESFVYATNLPSLAACKKVGFRQCGLQKEARWLCGEYVDLIMLEMLVSEYNVLYPENKNA